MSPTQLRPGDCLIYRPSSLMGRLIAIKTWSPWSHVEMAVGPGKAIGARSEGVGYYPTRMDKYLGMVMRPPDTFRITKALWWFDHYANGQAYDVLGLFRFFTFGKQSSDKQFCSELLTRVYRNAGVPELFGCNDADLIPPGWYATLSEGYGFTQVWSDEFK